ncbi:MAG: MerR family transcriptional regulator [Bacteroides sp.]|nr:MerR family transcriptional regulator [Bacteroides sp.]
MAYNPDKKFKMYYSIGEIADMFNVNESLLRFWEKEFPQIAPKKAGRGIRQYRQEDLQAVALVYHLVKERGMTLDGARRKLKENKEGTVNNFKIVTKLKSIRAELESIRKELDALEVSEEEGESHD